MAHELTIEKIKEMIVKNQEWLERAIIAIYNRQTRDEQSMEETRFLNSIGFSAADGSRGAYWAKWILRGNHLSGRHLEAARKAMPKYAKQLLEIAQEKAAQNA